MRLPTPSEVIFLSITGAIAMISTYATTPYIVKSVRYQIEQKKPKRNNEFNNGLILGAAIGTGVTLKVVASKVNNP